MDPSKYKDLNASTVTMVTSVKGLIDIVSAFELLPIYFPFNPDGTRFIHPTKTRNKIPYFGKPDTIVCMKYKGKVRGIRQNTGQMNNVVSIDLQCCNKNINLKLAQMNIQLTGANSEKMGVEAFNIICSKLNKIQEQVMYNNTLSKETKSYTLEWIQNHPDQTNILPENIDIKLFNFLYLYRSEFDNFADFFEKIKRVIEIKNLCTGEIMIDYARIINSVYNYTLGAEISLIEMTKHLRNKGFNANFHNWNTTYMNVSIPILEETTTSRTPETMASLRTESSGSAIDSIEDLDYEEDEEMEDEKKLKKNKKIRAHRFIIYRGGSIKQTSPTRYEDAEEIRNMILDAISDFPF